MLLQHCYQQLRHAVEHCLSPVSCCCFDCLLCCVAPLKKDDLWTQSRQNLEEAIEEEKESTSHKWDPDLLSHEQRLEQRLDKLNLDMYIMGSDGACQVST